MKARPHFNIGIIVPLKEEYRYITEIARQLESFSYEGNYFYRLDFGDTSVICCLIDQMGTLPAVQAVNRLLNFVEVSLVALIGTGGSLDGDINVGDVVVADEINEFQANAKAETVGTGYDVRYSGRHWPLEFRIREAITHFEFASGDPFSDWKQKACEDYQNIDLPNKQQVCLPPPSLHIGPIASGNIVAASSSFVAEVRRINRKFAAIDMEAAGVALAAVERIHPIPFLILRGISDRSNEEKRILDGEAKRAWRRYGVRNAASFLMNLVRWNGFLASAGITPSSHSASVRDLPRELILRLESCIGAAWLVGVTYNIYSHGPNVLDPKAPPLNLAILRIASPRIRQMLDAANEQREQLTIDGDIESASRRYANLIESFRTHINSPEIDYLLLNLDRVVASILFPESLASASPVFDSSTDNDAANPPNVHFDVQPGSREQEVAALADKNRWAEISALLKSIDPTHLSRVECEQGILASLHVQQYETANAIMVDYCSRYKDSGAIIFQREAVRRFPEFWRTAGRSVR